MRILYLSAWYPFPPNNGYKIRVYSLLRALATRHQVTLLSFVREGDIPLDPPPTFCERVETLPWQSYQPRRWRARLALFSSMPRSLVDTYSSAMQACVGAAEARAQFDVIIASTMDTARYALRSRTPVRVLEEHNFNTGLMRDQYAQARGVAGRLRYGLTYYKHRRFEEHVYRQFDGCTVVSELDRQRVAELVGEAVPLAVIPNCIDLDYYRSQYLPVPMTCVFNGSLTYSANFDGMQFFLDEIWSRIRRQEPRAQLKITGATRGVALNRLSLDNSVTLTGYLDDVRPAVGESWVAVAPLRYGGGTRLKILEAMALGTPVVATRKGAEGLEVRDREHLMLADAPAEFAERVLELFRSPDLRQALASNARALVRAKYDWCQAGQRFESFVCQVVRRRSL